MIRIVVADDHPVVRDGIAATLAATEGFEVVGQAASGPEAVAVVARAAPDVLIMDLRMPGGGGVDALKELRRTGSGTRVLVLTTYDTDSEVVAAIEAGATGYLLKDSATPVLVSAIRSTAAGETVLSPAVATRLTTHVHTPDRVAALSRREHQVLARVAKGTSNRAIARDLFVSEATVKTHLVHIYDKLHVSDRASAVAAGYERGILG